MVKKAKKAAPKEMVSLTDIVSPTVSEVQAPVVKQTIDELLAQDVHMSTRLNTIQKVGISIERKMDGQKSIVVNNKGAILGSMQVLAMLNSKLEGLQAASGRGDNVEVELRFINHLIEETKEIMVGFKQNVIRAEGIIEGLEQGVKECENLYNFERGRFVRQLQEMINPDFDDLADRRQV